jgi:hypothetical protein
MDLISRFELQSTWRDFSRELITQRELVDLPPVKPSAIALGTIFNHSIELAGKSSRPYILLLPAYNKAYTNLYSHMNHQLTTIV